MVTGMDAYPDNEQTIITIRSFKSVGICINKTTVRKGDAL